MKQKSLLVVILLSFFAINLKSQSFKNVIMDGQEEEVFSDYFEGNNYYCISGIQSNLNSYRNFVVKVSKNGIDTSIVYLDAFGTDIRIWKMFLYQNRIYSIETKSITIDTMQLCISIRDTNFNIITNKVFPNVINHYLCFNPTSKLKDSTLYLIGSFFNSTVQTYYPLFYKMNLNTLNILANSAPNLRCNSQDICFDNTYNKYHIISGVILNTNKFNNYILSFDSLLNFIDTTKIEHNVLGSSNILPYKNSGYLVSGKGIDGINFSSLYDQLRIQVLDSNFNTLTYKSFKFDNNSFIQSGYNQNLVQNNNKDYFIAGYLEKQFLQNVVFGVIIVKVDSNLNKIWQIRIPGNESMVCSKILPTNDGGILINIYMKDSILGDGNAYLIKIGPNGELTSMLNLGPVPKVKIQLFPNPATDFIEIKIENSFDKILFVEVFNIEGKLIERHEMMNSSKLNIEHLIAGVYFVNCTLQSGQKHTAKFVKVSNRN